jgi:hypothetical protein
VTARFAQLIAVGATLAILPGAPAARETGYMQGAAHALGAGTAVGAGGDLVTSCHPRACAAETCLCSIETLEAAMTSVRSVLRTAKHQGGEVWSNADASASTVGSGRKQAPGVPPARISLSAGSLAVTPVHLPGGESAPAGLLPGLLAVPPGWLRGDGVVVLTWDGLDPISGRDRLVRGLLDAGLAVLELDLATPRGFSVDSNRTPPEPTVEDFVADLLAIAFVLQQNHGAGAVAALGHGQGGEAALLAAARGGLTAGARLSPCGSVATAGEADQPDRRAAAARLCAAITAAAPEYWPATACAGGHHCSCAVLP